MYGYLTKGFTVGRVLTMRLLRNITSLPGRVIDIAIATVWLSGYEAYWEDGELYYIDGTKTGVFEGIFGFIGELIGLALGAVIGLTIGLAVFTVDMALKFTRNLQKSLYNGLSAIATYVGSSSFFDGFSVYRNPVSFRHKAWNIGAVFIGGLCAVVPYVLAKVLEFFIPALQDELSTLVTKLLSYLCGFATVIITMPIIWLAAHIIDRLGELYDIARIKGRHLIAIIYAKTGETPSKDNDCLPPDLHSKDFHQDVDKAKNTPWDKLLFGSLKDAAVDIEEDDDDLTDIITGDKLGINNHRVLVDACGHSFNDYGNEPKGIRFWLNQSKTCPISRAELTAEKLHPNVALNSFLNPNG